LSATTTSTAAPDPGSEADRARLFRGIGFGFLSYAVFATGDAFIKAVGPGVPVFTIGFFVSLFSGIVAFFGSGPGERWRDFWRMRHPGAVHLRAASGIVAGFCGIYAFTHLPLADAYALIFLMPFFVTLISRLVLGEDVGWRRWLALAIGFAGVMLVVRPGFREVGPAHLAAAAVALFGSITVIVLRKVAADERRTSLLATVFLYGIVVNGTLMLPGFVWPDAGTLLRLAAAGTLAGGGHVLIMAATRAAPANRVGPTQYSQILWAVLIGALVFGEFPDLATWAGLVLVALSGLATFLREERRGLWRGRRIILRNRP
jgi:S-adenosylmethionine uptake transporter